MTVFSVFSFSSYCRSIVLIASLFVGFLGGCSTEIDPTHPYDPDNPQKTQVQITFDLLVPNEGPEVDQIVLQWVDVETPTNFGLISITADQFEVDQDFQRATATLTKAFAGSHYVLFVQDGNGYSLDPQSSIFYVEEDQQKFTFELSVD